MHTLCTPTKRARKYMHSFTEAQLRIVQIKAYLCAEFERRSVPRGGWEANSLLVSSGLLDCVVCLNMESRG